jgi:hypothetical protein
MEFTNQTNCLNCGNALNTEFCGHCGQEKVQRITFKNLLLLIQRGTLELRSPLLKTIIGLTLRPAITCREYLDGKRIHYFNPAKYAFWLVTLSMVLASFLNVNMVEASIETFTPENIASEGFDAIKGILQNSLVYFFFITAFLMAMASKLAFRKEKYNIFELYVVYLLLNGHLTFLSIVLLAVGEYNHLYSQIGLVMMSVIYPAIVIARIYLPHQSPSYAKSLIAAILGFFFASTVLGFVAGFTSGFLDL